MKEMTKGGALSAADEFKLTAMIAQHQRIRSRLSPEYQTELDQLTVLVKQQLFARPIRIDLLGSAAQILNKINPALTKLEAWNLAEYTLGGIAGGIGTAAGSSGQAGPTSDTRPMPETQMSFNLQYLQLQSQMQNENRSYTAISNIMKTKHDTVKNSISNIR